MTIQCVVFCVTELSDALSDASSLISSEVVVSRWAKDPPADEERTKNFNCIDLLLYNAVFITKL